MECLSFNEFKDRLSALVPFDQKKDLWCARYNHQDVIIKDAHDNEMEIHHSISEHKNIASTFNITCRKFNGTFRHNTMVIEYAKHGDLIETLLGQKDPMSEAECKKWVHDILNALIFLGQHDIMHRDIKPDNIVRTADGTYQLIDFGDARRGPATTTSGYYIGTLQYMSPEIASLGYHTRACDMWSLGATLIAALLKQNPWFEIRTANPYDLTTYEKLKMREGFFDVSDKRLKNFSDKCKDFIRKIMVKDPKKRMTPEQAIEHAWFKDT
jgi:serine/threonine protein kinase